MSTTPTPPVSGPGNYGMPAGPGPSYGPPVSRPTSTLAIIALVLGALALIFSFIPLVNFVAFALAIASIVCAVVSLIRRSGGKSMAIIGLALSVVAFISAIVVNIVVATAISSASQAISKGLETYSAQASAKHTIEYKVTTNAPATVHYWAPDGTGQTDVSADWTKDISSTGFTSALVSVNSSDYKNTAAAVSCEIIIDGKSVAKNTGSGASASASCNATAD